MRLKSSKASPYKHWYVGYKCIQASNYCVRGRHLIMVRICLLFYLHFSLHKKQKEKHLVEMCEDLSHFFPKIYTLYSLQVPKSQDLKVPSLQQRAKESTLPRRGLSVPNPQRQMWIFWVQLPWRTSTTSPIMQWTAWSSEGLAGLEPPRRKEKRAKNKRSKNED